MVELITADQRDVRSSEFVAALRAEIRPMPGMERLIVRAPEGGPPGRELDVRIMGDDLEQLKQAAQDIILIADAVPGTTDIEEKSELWGRGADYPSLASWPLARLYSAVYWQPVARLAGWGGGAAFSARGRGGYRAPCSA